MIGRKIENTGNNCSESNRNPECNLLCLGEPAESGTTTAQTDDQPDGKANNETKRRQRKKINIPRPPSKLET
jgi:hypothetical protein